MAIKIGGIDNPTEVKFVNNGTTTNITEVWYKSSPSAEPVFVWPDIKQKWKINFSKHSVNSLPDVPSLYLANTYEIPLISDLEVGPGDTITLKGAYSAVGYPKEEGITWVVNLDGDGVKTYSSLTSNVTQIQNCKIRSWRLATDEDGPHRYIYNDSGTYYNDIKVDSVWTCPSELHWGSASGSTTFTDTCWWRPIFTLSTSRTISSVTLPAQEIVDNKVLVGWKINNTTYNPGASYKPTADEQTLVAIWEDKKPRVNYSLEAASYQYSTGTDPVYPNAYSKSRPYITLSNPSQRAIEISWPSSISYRTVKKNTASGTRDVAVGTKMLFGYKGEYKGEPSHDGGSSKTKITVYLNNVQVSSNSISITEDMNTINISGTITHHGYGNYDWSITYKVTTS